MPLHNVIGKIDQKIIKKINLLLNKFSFHECCHKYQIYKIGHGFNNLLHYFYYFKQLKYCNLIFI